MKQSWKNYCRWAAVLWWLPGALCAQTVRHVEARLVDGKVVVACHLETGAPVDLSLLYADVDSEVFKPCIHISGDLHDQTGGDKQIVWDCGADNIMAGAFIFKVVVEMSMAFVRGGVFRMGCTDEQGDDCYSGERPAHEVTLGDFYIGRYEVTQAQWTYIMGDNPSVFKGDDRPVENVSWHDVQEFIVRLNGQSAHKYRLPTEAEWEYAARGGAYGKKYQYSGGQRCDEAGWCRRNAGGATHNVGAKQPNELGIYDMCGNVWEWCSDWHEAYSASARVNPAGPDTGTRRVNRGGSWYDDDRHCRLTIRNADRPESADARLGFRLVRM